MQKNTNLAALEAVLSQKHGPTLEEIEERLAKAKAEQAIEETISTEEDPSKGPMLAIHTTSSHVVLDFSGPLTRLSMSPKQARSLAGMLLEKANKIGPTPRAKRRQRKRKN